MQNQMDGCEDNYPSTEINGLKLFSSKHTLFYFLVMIFSNTPLSAQIKSQKRESTKYCFALVRNVGAGLTNHRLIIVLTFLSCATYVVSKVFQIII